MSYYCPFCNHVCFDNGEITQTYFPSHSSSDLPGMSEDDETRNALTLTFNLCPNCGKTSFEVKPYWKNKEMHFSFSYPPVNTISLPDYIPAAIRHDYLEAVSIVDLSPKAAATLARRCLQGMIHDFWNIKEKNLNAEITSLCGKVPDSQRKAIDGLRKIGNIGAHMEKDVGLVVDVDPGEAKKLIKLIELLLQKWYVSRNDEETLLADITAIADEKENERKSVTSGE